MSEKFIIDGELRQIITNYIGAGSISKGMTWAEVQVILQKLESLEQAHPKPKIVESGT